MGRPAAPGGPATRRPAVTQRSLFRKLVTVASVTTRIRRVPTEVELGRGDGLPKRCVANLDTITTIPKRTLSMQITTLTPGKVAAVDGPLKFALGLR